MFLPIQEKTTFIAHSGANHCDVLSVCSARRGLVNQPRYCDVAFQIQGSRIITGSQTKPRTSAETSGFYDGDVYDDEEGGGDDGNFQIQHHSNFPTFFLQ